MKPIRFQEDENNIRSNRVMEISNSFNSNYKDKIIRKTNKNNDKLKEKKKLGNQNSGKSTFKTITNNLGQNLNN